MLHSPCKNELLSSKSFIHLISFLKIEAWIVNLLWSWPTITQQLGYQMKKWSNPIWNTPIIFRVGVMEIIFRVTIGLWNFWIQWWIKICKTFRILWLNQFHNILNRCNWQLIIWISISLSSGNKLYILSLRWRSF